MARNTKSTRRSRTIRLSLLWRTAEKEVRVEMGGVGGKGATGRGGTVVAMVYTGNGNTGTKIWTGPLLVFYLLIFFIDFFLKKISFVAW